MDGDAAQINLEKGNVDKSQSPQPQSRAPEQQWPAS